MPRTLLHLDLDAFFCAVEELHDSSLRGKPFAVGGRPDERGVVASCSYAARAAGVRSAMPMSQALRLCPKLIIVNHHRGNYSEMSRQVMERLNNLSPLVEQISIDEAFVDISDIREPAERIARRVQDQINLELTLPCSIGIASNKLVAKLATEVGKKSKRTPTSPAVGIPTTGVVGGLRAHYPNALTIVPAGQEAEFLAPLPVEMLWGVGPKTGKRLGELGIHTIGALAAWPESDLIARFGENGRDLSRHARGLDERPVESEHETKSISQETTFARDVRDDKALEKMLRELSAEVAHSLRKENLAGKTVKLKLRWPDFTTLTRQTTLSTPTDQADKIAEAAIQLLHKVRAPNAFVRLIGVGVSGLGAPIRQLGLWDVGSEKARKLQEVLDALQEKYGSEVVKKGK